MNHLEIIKDARNRYYVTNHGYGVVLIEDVIDILTNEGHQVEILERTLTQRTNHGVLYYFVIRFASSPIRYRIYAYVLAGDEPAHELGWILLVSNEKTEFEIFLQEQSCLVTA